MSASVNKEKVIDIIWEIIWEIYLEEIKELVKHNSTVQVLDTTDGENRSILIKMKKS